MDVNTLMIVVYFSKPLLDLKFHAILIKTLLCVFSVMLISRKKKVINICMHATRKKKHLAGALEWK